MTGSSNHTVGTGATYTIAWDSSASIDGTNYGFPTSGDNTKITYKGGTINLVLLTLVLDPDAGAASTRSILVTVNIKINGSTAISGVICLCGGTSNVTIMLWLDETNPIVLNDVITVTVVNNDATYTAILKGSSSLIEFLDLTSGVNTQSSP